jgi:formate hydrogenlyase subunit 6/NADH:ubiquinone oxidoreductase subunit I
VCLVEVNGKLRPACATPLSDGDTVQTHSPEVDAYRRRDVEMLLSRHPEDCMRCEVEHECRLRTVVNELQPARVAVTPRGRGAADSHRLHAQDHTSVAIDRDVDKCIDCNLCVDVCGAGGQEQYIFGMVERGAGMLQTTAFDRALADTQCISCGQCTLVCPTGALTEQSVWRDVLSALNARTHTTMVQVAPATRVALGEEFGLAPGSVSTGRLVRALRLLGFDLVFDTNFAADLTIMEETHELLGRVADPNAALPLFTSCCPVSLWGVLALHLLSQVVSPFPFRWEGARWLVAGGVPPLRVPPPNGLEPIAGMGELPRTEPAGLAPPSLHDKVTTTDARSRCKADHLAHARRRTCQVSEADLCGVFRRPSPREPPRTCGAASTVHRVRNAVHREKRRGAEAEWRGRH